MGLPVIPDHGLCRSPTMQNALAANTEDNSNPAKEDDVTNIQQENGPVVEGDWVEGSGQDMGGVEVMYKMRQMMDQKEMDKVRKRIQVEKRTA